MARRNKNREKGKVPQRFEPRTISSTICHLSCPGTYIFKVGFRFRILGPELILVLPLVEVGLEPHRRFPGFRQQPGPKISGLLLDQHELDESRPDLEPGPLARIIKTGWSLLFFKRSNPGLFFWFSSFLNCNWQICTKKYFLAYVRVGTTDRCCQKQPLCHCATATALRSLHPWCQTGTYME